MRGRAICAAALAAALSMSGCADWSVPDKPQTRITVVASTDVWGSIATAVGGDTVEVTSLIASPGLDPHSYQASVRDVLAVKEADVVVENGGGYDVFMDDLVDSSETDAVVLNAVATSGHEDDGEDLNEHVWYDLHTASSFADEMARVLGEADPARTARYRANAEAFNRGIARLLSREATLKDRFAGVGVGITEPLPLYLLEAVGAVNRTPPDFSEAVEEGEDVSVSALDATLSLYSDHQVAALVYNEQTNGAVTELVLRAADDAGVAVVGVTETLPAGMDYLAWMRSNLDQLTQALDSA